MSIALASLAAAAIAHPAAAEPATKVPPKRQTIATAAPALIPEAR